MAVQYLCFKAVWIFVRYAACVDSLVHLDAVEGEVVLPRAVNVVQTVLKRERIYVDDGIILTLD